MARDKKMVKRSYGSQPKQGGNGAKFKRKHAADQ